MPPPALFSSTIIDALAQAPRGEQGADVVGERHVADQQHHRALAVRRPRRTRSTPCRRSRSRRGCTARAAGLGGPARRSRCRAPASRRRRTALPSRAAARRARRRPRLVRAVGAEHAQDRLGRALVGGCASSTSQSARRIRRAARWLSRPARASAVRRASRAGSSASESLSTDAGSCHAPSGSSATCGVARGPRASLRSGFETGRSPTRSTRSGVEARGEALVAQQRVVVGDRRIAAPRAGQRVGEQRPAGAARNAAAASRRAASRARGGPPRPRRARAPRASSSSRSIGACSPSAPAPRAAARHVGRAALATARVRRQLALDHQRLAQREVQVHDARPALERGRVGAAGDRAHPAQPPRAWRPRVPTSKNHFAAAPYSFSWSIAWPAPFSRSSGGRSAVSSSSGTRASCASIAAGSSSAAAVPEVHVDRHRQPRRLREPQREESRAALVDVRVAAEARLARERQHQRRAARARRGARRAHAAARELVHERAQQHVGVGGHAGS